MHEKNLDESSEISKKNQENMLLHFKGEEKE
jgi:hypothetical protein